MCYEYYRLWGGTHLRKGQAEPKGAYLKLSVPNSEHPHTTFWGTPPSPTSHSRKTSMPQFFFKSSRKTAELIKKISHAWINYNQNIFSANQQSHFNFCLALGDLNIHMKGCEFSKHMNFKINNESKFMQILGMGDRCLGILNYDSQINQMWTKFQ